MIRPTLDKDSLFHFNLRLYKPCEPQSDQEYAPPQGLHTIIAC